MNGWFTVPGKEDNLMTLGHAPFPEDSSAKTSDREGETDGNLYTLSHGSFFLIPEDGYGCRTVSFREI